MEHLNRSLTNEEDFHWWRGKRVLGDLSKGIEVWRSREHLALGEGFTIAVYAFLLLVALGQLRGCLPIDPGSPSRLQQTSLKELCHHGIISESQYTCSRCSKYADQTASWIEWREMVPHWKRKFSYQKSGDVGAQARSPTR